MESGHNGRNQAHRLITRGEEDDASMESGHNGRNQPQQRDQK